MKHLKIDTLASKVLRALANTDREKEYRGNFKLVVYMDHQSFNKIEAEIQGLVSLAAMEFIEHRTVFEVPIYRVMCDTEHLNITEIKP